MIYGFVYAIATILLFGSWAVPAAKINVDPKVKAFWLTVGHLFLSGVVFLFTIQPITSSEFIGPFIAGLFWGIGILSGYVGIKHLGITRAIGIWVPAVIVVSALWGLLFFDEARMLNAQGLITQVTGLLLLIGAALLVIVSNKGEERLGNMKLGVVSALLLGVFHGSYFVPLRTSNLPITASFVPLSIGMVLVMIAVLAAKRISMKGDVRSIMRMISSGLILGAGNYTALLTINILGVSRGYPLTQLAIVVNTIWGICYLKEVTTSKKKLLIIVGIILAIIGAILINSVRN